MPKKILCIVFTLLFSIILSASSYQLQIISRVNDNGWSNQKLVNISENDRITLSFVLIHKAGKSSEYLSCDGQNIEIDGKACHTKKFDEARLTSISWYKIEPLMQHREKGNDPTVPDYLWYTNAYTPSSPKISQGWIDFDRVVYQKTQVSLEQTIQGNAHPVQPEYDLHNGLGAMRYMVKMQYDGKKYRTADEKTLNYLGISEKVFRLTVRADDSYLGYATSYFNVPGIYGSHERQVDRYIGVDCADLVVGAHRRWKPEKDTKYTGVNGLRKIMKAQGTKYALFRNGRVAEAKSNNTMKNTFKKGMIVMFDYPGSRMGWYDHVAIMYKDNGNNVIDGNDLILHCGPMEPRITKLKSQGGVLDFPTIVRFYTWD